MTRCPQCGQETVAEARFCDACGASLAPLQAHDGPKVAQDVDRRESVARTARVLRESVVWNGENAASLAEDLRRGTVPVRTRLEVERWEAVREEFLESAQDPELQGRVAFFFDQVRRAAQLAEIRFEFGFGVSSEMSWAPDVEAALHRQLADELPAIAQEAPELNALLGQLEARP